MSQLIETDNHCFLCSPDADLNAMRTSSLVVVAGLGPISSLYAVIGAREHVRSLADAALFDNNFTSEFVATRAALHAKYGNIVLTEHGRVPLCREDADEHKGHCFHGHALAFACNAEINQLAASYYHEYQNFSDIRAALSFAATKDNYFLTSHNDADFSIFSRPLNAPRQLARLLIASSLGCAHKADWREFPDRAAARSNKTKLVKALELT